MELEIEVWYYTITVHLKEYRDQSDQKLVHKCIQVCDHSGTLAMLHGLREVDHGYRVG